MELGDWGKSTPSKGRGLDVEMDSGPPRCDSPCEAEDCSFIVVVVVGLIAARFGLWLGDILE